MSPEFSDYYNLHREQVGFSPNLQGVMEQLTPKPPNLNREQTLELALKAGEGERDAWETLRSACFGRMGAALEHFWGNYGVDWDELLVIALERVDKLTRLWVKGKRGIAFTGFTSRQRIERGIRQGIIEYYNLDCLPKKISGWGVVESYWHGVDLVGPESELLRETVLEEMAKREIPGFYSLEGKKIDVFEMLHCQVSNGSCFRSRAFWPYSEDPLTMILVKECFAEMDMLFEGWLEGDARKLFILLESCALKETQTHLASRLKLSPSRVNQLIHELMSRLRNNSQLQEGLRQADPRRVCSNLPPAI